MRYFKDEGIASAITPIKILLHITAYGRYGGAETSNPELRTYF